MGKRVDETTKQAAYDMFEQGSTIKDVAETLGISENTASKLHAEWSAMKRVTMSDGGGVSPPTPTSVAARVLKEMFSNKKHTDRVVDIIEQSPEFYETNLMALYNLLRGMGFNDYEIRAFMTEYQQRAMKERFTMGWNGMGFGGFGGFGNPWVNSQPDPFAMVNQMIMQAMAFAYAKPIIRSLFNDGEREGKNSILEQFKEVATVQYLADLMSSLRGSRGDGGEITTVKLPKINPDGKIEFVDTPVKTSGAAIYEMMLPLMLMAMSGKKKDDDESKLLSTVIEVAKVLKPEQPQTDKYYELMKESFAKIESLKTDLIKSELKRLEDKFESLKENNKGTFEDFLDKAKKISEDLGLPLFGASDKVFDYKLELKKLELDNLDKTIDQKLKLLEKIGEIEQRMELGKAIKDVLSKGIGSFAEGLGKSVGEGLAIQMTDQSSQGKPKVIDLNKAPAPRQAPQPNEQQPKGGVEELKNLTVKALGELHRLGETEFLKMVHDKLEKVVAKEQ